MKKRPWMKRQEAGAQALAFNKLCDLRSSLSGLLFLFVQNGDDPPPSRLASRGPVTGGFRWDHYWGTLRAVNLI